MITAAIAVTAAFSSCPRIQLAQLVSLPNGLTPRFAREVRSCAKSEELKGYLALSNMGTKTFIDVADAVASATFESDREFNLRPISMQRRAEVLPIWKGMNLGDLEVLNLKLAILFWLMFEYSKEGKINPWTFTKGVPRFEPVLSWSASGAILSYHSVVIPSVAELRLLRRRSLTFLKS